LERVQELLRSAKEKMYAARLKRPTPYVDKTIYVGWNSLCISAYLDAAKVFNLDSARQFALRSLDRILSAGWNDETGLQHVIAYSDGDATSKRVSGLLDDYAFAAIACLDAYEATSDLSYFNFAVRIADHMVDHFFDHDSGGFFDTEKTSSEHGQLLGVLGSRRKPFQDSPTPAGNSVAAIALARVYGYTNRPDLQDKARCTLEVLGGLAAQYGIFAATYAIAGVHFSEPHTQIVILGDDAEVEKLYKAALANFRFGKSVLKLERSKAVKENLPPSLAETIPQLPAIRDGKSMAILCTDFTCLSPIFDPEALSQTLKDLTPSPKSAR